MKYDKLLIDDNGEEFPYYELIDDDGYFYGISIIVDGKDGQLCIMNHGTDIQFDDGSMIDFNFSPEDLFAGKTKLSEKDLLSIMDHLSSAEISESSCKYSKAQVQHFRAEFNKSQETED